MPKKIKTQTRDGLLTKKEFDQKIELILKQIQTVIANNNQLILDIIGEILVLKGVCENHHEYYEMVRSKNTALGIYKKHRSSPSKTIIEDIKKDLDEKQITYDYLQNEIAALEAAFKQTAPTIKIDDVNAKDVKEE